MGKTKYSSDWEKEFKWLSSCKTDKSLAFCKICNKTFSISGSGVSQVRHHGTGQKHLKFLKELKGSQRTFVRNENKQVQLSDNAFKLTDSEKVLKAEVLQALHVAQYNISFSSSADHSSLFKLMFPDSAIAACYRQSYSKIAYILKYGIADYLKEALLYDVKSVPFTFKFDETTTVQTKKQYDGYLQYWSPSKDQIVNAYCGSIFIGHCSSEDLATHYHEFECSLGLNSDHLLHLGMDGPNVNKKFSKILAKEFDESNQSQFLDLGTCSLHPVHTAFRKGISKLQFDFDEFFNDIHFFFKLSSARREDYASLQTVTNLTAEYAKKHSSTRWLSMKYVCIRILEQLPNLKEYFLTFLPKTKEFNKLKTSERYVRICNALKDDLTEVYLSFCAFCTEDFESFLVQFQYDEPMIHMLHEGMFTLLKSLLKKFIKKTILFESADTLKSNENIFEVDVLKPTNHKSLKFIELGTKAKLHFSDCVLLGDDKETKFRKECLNFYIESTSYLKNTLPFDCRVIKYAQYLHHDKRSVPEAMSGISNLALKITKVINLILTLAQHLISIDRCIPHQKEKKTLNQLTHLKLTKTSFELMF